MIITEAKLRQVVTRMLGRAGSSAYEAEVVTDHLVRANLTGHDSHGVGMLPTYMRNLNKGILKPNQHPELAKDSGNIMMYDGLEGYGQVQAKEAMAGAIARAKESNLVLMTLRNSHHIGRIGTYGEMAIEAGLISIHFVNVVDHGPTVAPYGGTQARFVTNPVCIAIPGTSQTKAILLDMATSKIALGKARVAKNKGVPVPDNSVIDAEGLPTNNPNVLFEEPQGSLLPFGDYKGTGLALVCEILAGALSGGGTIQPGNKRRGGTTNNMFTVIVKPDALVDYSYLNYEIDELVRYVKDTPAQLETGPVRIAGEPERLAFAERSQAGISLEQSTWEQIIEAAQSIGFAASEIEQILAP
ncbi:MAG: malate/lactate/ureidoglycolate dehydrogenase [Trueperaceae bacterium]|nr:malate/lactate/ureidoglycolate dehydrogenase [Trueperaceae bacterium]